MSKISTLVGEVVNGTPEEYMEKAGEVFYRIRVNFKGTEIDVVMSQYTKEEKYEGKIQVTGYLASQVPKKAIPKFYFFASSIVNVDIDTPMTNEVQIQCKISRIGKMQPNHKGVDALTIYASDFTPLRTTSVLYLCVKDRLARMMQNKPVGFYVNGIGELKPFRDVYEVVMSEIDETAAQPTNLKL